MNTKQSHTPGPWKWDNEWAEDSSACLDGSMGGLEPNVLWFGMDGEEGIYCPNEVNARLIAAAPDLLKELCELSVYLQQAGATEQLNSCLKAIAKVER